MTTQVNPWSDREQEPGKSIQIDLHGIPVFTLTLECDLWVLRRVGEPEVLERDQYRNDLFSAVQAGRLVPDYSRFAEKMWPDLPAQQRCSVATYLYLGWKYEGLGKEGEVNLSRGFGMNRSDGYVRADGVFRPA